jgi:hypothetical protein
VLLVYTEIMNFTFAPHALEQLQRREIPTQVVLSVLEAPEQIMAAKGGRSAYQSKINMNDGEYLLRLIVEPDGTVVTVYLISKIDKYWSES